MLAMTNLAAFVQNRLAAAEKAMALAEIYYADGALHTAARRAESAARLFRLAACDNDAWLTRNARAA